MIISRTVKSFEQARKASGIAQAETGFVPTMGALHTGHITLLQACKVACRQSIVSIFVNPRQFNDPADFSKYPRTTEDDIALLEAAGCDILFLPDVAEMYPEPETYPYPAHYPLGRLEELLEGEHRPGHYQGVCQVMHRLLRMVQPAQLFMGQKDFQQCQVVQRLMTDQQLHTHFVMVPTVREADGLAMSSRNRRLNDAQREQAAAIFQAMQTIKGAIHQGQTDYRSLEAKASQHLREAGFGAIDYVSIAHTVTLEPATQPTPPAELVVLVAAFLGDVRLIDNLPLA